MMNRKISIPLFVLLGAAAFFMTFSRGIFSKDNTDKKLKQRAQEAYSYCKKNHMNTNYCILVDFNIHSGKIGCLHGILKKIELNEQA
ncbi:hypothetical protein [Riemerella columbipharyngis]|uniref:Uncharacterized protein n=1 Tax=Riemerella columbipharyngis TaxID=1071918 RepID=A0A1G7CTH2_9FLAO|nr:hypothetical protein [Riemerella columbipharyngis]SDE42662.1 hypothetical protein SAMN05421544_10917 [Riemerella columbipharyngis]